MTRQDVALWGLIIAFLLLLAAIVVCYFIYMHK